MDAESYRIKVGSFFEQTAADVYELYEQRIHSMNAMDFDDLLYRCVTLFELFDVQDDFLQFHFLLQFSATPAYSDAHSCPVASPPRPELDPNVSFEAARQDAPDRLTAAEDLRGAGHFRLEEL